MEVNSLEFQKTGIKALAFQDGTLKGELQRDGTLKGKLQNSGRKLNDEPRKFHHPKHLYLDNTWYFLTARVYQNSKIFDTGKKKDVLLKIMQDEFDKVQYQLWAWVILDNHYHIEFKTKTGNVLPKLLNCIHGVVSYQINKTDRIRGRRVFQNYWDKCLRSEKDIFIHLNYLHQNPSKHRYIRDFRNFEFSSYKKFQHEYGDEWLEDCFRRYPVIDFTLKEDND